MEFKFISIILKNTPQFVWESPQINYNIFCKKENKKEE